MDYSRLDPLISICGEKITNVSDWETFRRDEIMVLLTNFIYGIRPVEKPKDINFSVTDIQEDCANGEIVKKTISISFCGFSMEVYLFLPADCYKVKPVPVMLHILNEKRNDIIENFLLNDTFLPIYDITKRNYGVAVMPTSNVSPDWIHKSEFKQGVFKAIQPDTSLRNKYSWGNISGWAFGASRVLDYLETDEDVISTSVGVIGHSRAGKAALWASATDTRFAFTVSNGSGCSGAAFTRDMSPERERVKNLLCSDWFCDNYRKYADREEMLPFDQHLLIAAIAPRPVYVKSNIEDLWAGPEGEMLSCRLASPVYELYGLPGFIADEKAKLNTPYHKGTIGYHLAEGDHNLDRNDWQIILDFADKYLK